MRTLKLALIALIFSSATASLGAAPWKAAAKGRGPSATYSPGLVLKALQANEAVRGALAFARKNLGPDNKVQCTDISVGNLKTMSDVATFTAKGSCNVNEPNNEATISFEIKGTMYSPAGDTILDSIKFDYAG